MLPPVVTCVLLSVARLRRSQCNGGLGTGENRFRIAGIFFSCSVPLLHPFRFSLISAGEPRRGIRGDSWGV